MKKLAIPFAVAMFATAHVARAADTAWPSYNGSLSSDRFSLLTEITPANAGDLRPACELALGDEGSFQTGLVVVGDTMFATTLHTVVALNAANCTARWRYVYEDQDDVPWPVNRGVATMDGRVFRGTGDGLLIALDVAKGSEVWRAQIANPKLGEYLSAAPLAWNGLVYMGPAGSEYGIRGRVAAFDAATGREVWRFNTIPGPGEPGYETWHIPDTAVHGGGGSWTTYTLDPRTGELFVSVANPAPDYSPNDRPGDNLYTNGIVVLDAKTGALKWYYQFGGNDGFDYDVAAAPMLYTDKAGKRRVAVGSKDGFLYVLDRDTHKLVSKTPVTTIEKATSAPTPQGVHACPGSIGGVEWNGPAYSPKAGLVYTGAVDWCATFYSAPSTYEPPKFFLGGLPKSDTNSKTGWLTAVDGRTGKTAWRYHTGSPVLSGATPTAGGVVFSGDAAGEFLAFNAKNGELLNKQDLGGSMGSGVITYEVAGKQYVATTTGNISRSGLSSELNTMPRIIIMTTGLALNAAPVRLGAAPTAELSRHFGANQGKGLYGIFCAACHGSGGTGGPGGPALQSAAKRMQHEEMVTWLKNPAPPMPKLAPPMTGPEVDAAARYVESLK